MPSPVGHALGGLIVALAAAPPVTPSPETPHDWMGRLVRMLRLDGDTRLVVWCMVAACLPDVDFAWARHNMETHSIGFAMLVGAATLAWRHSGRLALATTLSVSTHVLFDWLGSDDSPPLGVMALWPITSAFYYADAWVFGAISRHYWRSDFVSQNLLAILREVLILMPIVMTLVHLRGRRSRR